ncbi:glucose-1-phosphate adenylyltransferase [Celerinatantimonas sp. MCCC 1A17872]|uniref:glucose-1-phosphate adenylyltransferase n=1 Tax=Celerinatantimonas sp. MCCC 1A17872 TaxID=3177514 RepID=UPI0038C1E4D5
MLEQAITVILAGGKGSRLSPLTQYRAKPAVPFGGKYRLIDFTLANCLHSGLRRILVLTQYQSHSLHKHLRDGWSIFNPELGEFITPVPPQMSENINGYRGTADAIYQNLYLLERNNAKYVVILSGDHIYRMDYEPMLRQHIQTRADLTLACMEIDAHQSRHFGIVSANSRQQVEGFVEKPEHPPTLEDNPERALASMGVYIFSLDYLKKCLCENAEQNNDQFDFGHHIIPQAVQHGQVYVYHFGGASGRVSRDQYWRDVGTLDSYYQANMDLLQSVPPIDLYQSDWLIRSYQKQVAPAKMVSGASGTEGITINSIVSGGVVVSGGCVQHSILFQNVRVLDEAVVESSILCDDVEVGPGCRLNRCIIDKNVVIPPGTEIGINKHLDKQRFTISEDGVVVIPKNYRFE